jgi:hypothetical protein
VRFSRPSSGQRQTSSKTSFLSIDGLVADDEEIEALVDEFEGAVFAGT